MTLRNFVKAYHSKILFITRFLRFDTHTGLVSKNDLYIQTPWFIHSHSQSLSHTLFEIQTDTDRHRQTDTDRHRQTQTDTDRHRQTQTDTPKFNLKNIFRTNFRWFPFPTNTKIRLYNWKATQSTYLKKLIIKCW